MARIEVPSGVVDVVSAGEGPDLVLLHSLLIDRSAFERVVPFLARHRRVHLLALPGFDDSTNAGPTVEDYADRVAEADRKSTRLNSSHDQISYAVFCLKKK